MSLSHGRNVSLRCLSHLPGPRFLDGHTHDGTVGLAPTTDPPFTGTQWRVFRVGEGIVALKCLGNLEGPRWLDGHTHDGTLGLAPEPEKPFTGTRWKVFLAEEGNPDIVILQCLGHIEGPRFLDGRTQNGSAGLAPNTNPPFTGTRWEVRGFPVLIDDD